MGRPWETHYRKIMGLPKYGNMSGNIFYRRIPYEFCWDLSHFHRDSEFFPGDFADTMCGQPNISGFFGGYMENAGMLFLVCSALGMIHRLLGMIQMTWISKCPIIQIHVYIYIH